MAGVNWVVTPPIEALREQLNKIAPDRDKTTDGSIGNLAHQGSRSSHNEDLTGNAEHKDGDAIAEVRARDFDKDLRRPGLTMAMVVRHLVLGARAGRFWWIRYIIFDKIIYHKNTGYEARAYTGSNTHEEHAHVNGDFTQAADSARNVDYGLDELIDMPLTDADVEKIAKRTAQMVLNEFYITDHAAEPDPKTGERRKLTLATWIGYADHRRNFVIRELSSRLATAERALASMVQQTHDRVGRVGAVLDGPIPTQLNVIEDAVTDQAPLPTITPEQLQAAVVNALLELGSRATDQ